VACLIADKINIQDRSDDQ